MPQQMMTAVENNFSGGLKTEFTGLNFPENACTSTDNCVFSLIGEVSRRAGIDFEDNFLQSAINKTNKAVASYKWNNVGGDGQTKVYVLQVGTLLHFFRSTDATEATPLSSTKLASTIDISSFTTGGVTISTAECQFTDGNGYLFVFHPGANPFYCTYNAGTITATAISIKIRDFLGLIDEVPTQYRPLVLNGQHNYNLYNQGWSSAASWSAESTTSNTFGTGSKVFTIASGLTISNGTPVVCVGSGAGLPPGASMAGTVTSYSSTTLTLNITSYTVTGASTNWTIAPINAGLLNTWIASQGNVPSNADIWWRFKDVSGVFDPASTQANVTLGTGPAHNGFYILEAFNQNRSAVSGIVGLTDITTTARPKTGAWFQGRIWYAGTDSSQQATGLAPYYTWTESIYFSQIVEKTSQFGMCYQNNDPTSEDFFDLLPTDGGLITIQGSGAIYKLFPVQNGLLVFASNGIWFITGSQGIGFAANDYTITNISSVKAMSATSFIDVLGYPMFWNEEGIYTVTPSPQGGGLVVNNLCQGTILSFYKDIPNISKKYARGDFDPTSFVISWVYRNEAEVGIPDRYNFDRVLNFNITNKSFYPFSLYYDPNNPNSPYVHDVKYVHNPGGSALSAPSKFKYLTSVGGDSFTFSEEWDETNWVDFFSSSVPADYESYFVTGYKLHGQAIRKFQPIYVQMFSKAEVPSAYKIQGIWDYANHSNSGRYTNIQTATNALTRFGIVYRKHKIRGSGIALQLKVTSVEGMPFNIIGWASMEAQNASI